MHLVDCDFTDCVETLDGYHRFEETYHFYLQDWNEGGDGTFLRNVCNLFVLVTQKTTITGKCALYQTSLYRSA